MAVLTSAAPRTMPKTPPPPGYEEIQHEELSRLFGRITAGRLLALPLVVGLLVWVALAKVTPWRQGTLIVLGLLVMAVFVHEDQAPEFGLRDDRCYIQHTL